MAWGVREMVRIAKVGWGSMTGGGEGEGDG